MNEIDTALEQVKGQLAAIQFASGPYFFAADACLELGLWYARSIRHVPECELYYFPKKDTVNLRPRHRVMLSERGLRTLVKIAAAKWLLRKCA